MELNMSNNFKKTTVTLNSYLKVRYPTSKCVLAGKRIGCIIIGIKPFINWPKLKYRNRKEPWPWKKLKSQMRLYSPLRTL